METSRLYIAVRDQVPDYIVPTLVAHTILNADAHFKENLQYQAWKNLSFKKCVIRVNEKEWNKITALEDVYLGYENRTLNAEMSCAVVLPCPNSNIANVLKFAKLWQPVATAAN